jgi:non-homologous end joining protein Ku
MKYQKYFFLAFYCLSFILLNANIKDWIDGEWIDVKNDDVIDEDDIKARIEKDEQKETELNRDDLNKLKNEQAKEIVLNRILTSEEHQKIAAEQALKMTVDTRRKMKSADKLQDWVKNVISQWPISKSYWFVPYMPD